MKRFEHDKIMYEHGRELGMEQGRQAERINTEKEKQKVRELEEVVKKLQAQLKNGKISGI